MQRTLVTTLLAFGLAGRMAAQTCTATLSGLTVLDDHVQIDSATATLSECVPDPANDWQEILLYFRGTLVG